MFIMIEQVENLSIGVKNVKNKQKTPRIEKQNNLQENSVNWLNCTMKMTKEKKIREFEIHQQK